MLSWFESKSGSKISNSVYYVYILLCGDGSLYTGITNDLKKRLLAHQTGKGGHYTRSREAVEFVYTEKHETRSLALKREAEIKKLKKEQKQKLISSWGLAGNKL